MERIRNVIIIPERFDEVGLTVVVEVVQSFEAVAAGDVDCLIDNPHSKRFEQTRGEAFPAEGLDGCLQRLRYTGGEVQMIDQVKVVPEGIQLTFTFDIDPDSACDPASYNAEMWNYLWSQQYGSDQFSVRKPGERGHDSLKIENVRKLSDRTVLLVIPDLTVCDQLLLRMNFCDAKQRQFAEQVYLTIHAIPN